MHFKTILLTLSAVAFIIGVHQSLIYGFFESYWLFMSSGLFFLWYQYKKNKLAALRKTPPTKNKNKQKKKKTKR